MTPMKLSYLFLASAALAATACNAEKGSNAATDKGPEVTAAAVPAPNPTAHAIREPAILFHPIVPTGHLLRGHGERFRRPPGQCGIRGWFA